MSRFMAECPHCDEMFDDEDDWFEHVSCCEEQDGSEVAIYCEQDGEDEGEPCRECGQRGCNGECYGDDMMGDSA